MTGEDGTQSSKYLVRYSLYETKIRVCVAFPVSGMMSIPVSMYQTVVTNLNLQGEANQIPITMSQLTGHQTGNDDDNEDVKNVLNGGHTIRITSTENNN